MKRRSLLGMLGAAGVGGAAAVTAAAAGANTEGHRLYGHSWDHDAERANNAGLGNGEHRRIGSGRIVWSVDTTERVVALTFDDGPDPALTSRVLDELDAASASATFMMMGWNAHTNRALALDVEAAGHEIGSHGWSHLDLAQCSPEQVTTELTKGKAAIEAVTRAPVRWFRPARGVLTGHAIRVATELGHDIAMWSLTAAVSDRQSSDRVGRQVVDNAGPGDIVCLHDGLGRGTFARESKTASKLLRRRTAELDALGPLLNALSARDFRFVTLSELEALDGGSSR